MLEAIRSRSASFLVKALFVLLIISFGAWGIGDILRGDPSGNAAITVGDTDITLNRFNDEYRREMRRMQGIFGRQLDREQAKAIGVPNRVMSRLVSNTLVDLDAVELKLIVSDEQIRGAILKTPSFFNSQKQFDQQMFEEVLRSNGFSEGQFVGIMRGDISRNQILGSFSQSGASPKQLVDTVYRYRMEKRTAKTFLVADDAMSGVAAPSDEMLTQFHTDNAKQFTAPEYRKATVVVIDANDLAAEIKVDDAAVNEAFEQRQDEFNLPERRELKHIVTQKEEDALKALDRLRKGEDFALVAKEVANMDGDAVKLGNVTRLEILPEMAEAAFSMVVGSYSKPVKSPLGWHVLGVSAVTPAKQQTLLDVKKMLSMELAKEKAIDSSFNLANKLEDALGGGASLEEAAAGLNLKVRVVDAIDRQGRNLAGTAITDLPPGNEFVKTVFETGEAQESVLTEAGSEAFFLLRVDQITEPTLRPLASVRADVAKAWDGAERRKMAEAKAKALVDQLKEGAVFAGMAQLIGAKINEPAPFLRNHGDGALPPALVKELFAGKSGDVAAARGQGGHVVGQLLEITPANPSADQKTLDTVAEGLTESFRNDLFGAYTATLRAKYPVNINEKVLESFL